MIGIEGVEEERWSACARQGGGYLGAYVSAFAYTCHHHFSFAVENHFYCFVKVVVELWFEVEYGFCLVFKTGVA